MNIRKVRLSTILIPIGAFGSVLYLFFVLSISPFSSDSVMKTFLAYIGALAFICLPAGLVVWAIEKFQTKAPGISDGSKQLRTTSLWVAVFCVFVIIIIIWQWLHASFA